MAPTPPYWILRRSCRAASRTGQICSSSILSVAASCSSWSLTTSDCCCSLAAWRWDTSDTALARHRTRTRGMPSIDSKKSGMEGARSSWSARDCRSHACRGPGMIWIGSDPSVRLAARQLTSCLTPSPNTLSAALKSALRAIGSGCRISFLGPEKPIAGGATPSTHPVPPRLIAHSVVARSCPRHFPGVRSSIWLSKSVTFVAARRPVAGAAAASERTLCMYSSWRTLKCP